MGRYLLRNKRRREDQRGASSTKRVESDIADRSILPEIDFSTET